LWGGKSCFPDKKTPVFGHTETQQAKGKFLDAGPD
jgi:hypothetical protein